MSIYSVKTIAVATTALGTNTATSWCPMNIEANPFCVSLGFKLTSGLDTGAVFRVQHTFDDVFDSNVTPVAFTHVDMSAMTANMDGNYAFPVRGIRLLMTSGGSASSSLTITQTGL